MTASSCPLSEHSSGTISCSAASGVTSAFSTPGSPQTSRAYSMQRVLEAAAGAEEGDPLLAGGPDGGERRRRRCRTGCRAPARSRRTRARSHSAASGVAIQYGSRAMPSRPSRASMITGDAGVRPDVG